MPAASPWRPSSPMNREPRYEHPAQLLPSEHDQFEGLEQVGTRKC